MADGTTALNETAQSRIKQFIERIERLQGVKADADADISDTYKSAKGEGFDTTALKRVIAKRAKDPAKLSEEDQLVELYETAAKAAGQ